MKYTILGAQGFIGSHVAAMARSQGHKVLTPDRAEDLTGRNLGHVIYAIGVTADFRSRPYDTVVAHVTRLLEILTQTRFDSFVYLSSTRVYSRCANMAGLSAMESVDEETIIPVLPDDPSDLYNISKLLGESVTLLSWPRARVARLSNVLGPDYMSENFVISVIRDSLQNGKVVLRSALNSAKDYISVDDVARVLLMLCTQGHRKIYNVASGVNTTHEEIISRVHQITSAEFSVEEGSQEVVFPKISTSALVQDLGFTFQTVESIIPPLVNKFRRFLTQQ